MKYLVYGAGGTGGCLAAFLAMGGKDVTLIALGRHRDAIEKTDWYWRPATAPLPFPSPPLNRKPITSSPM